MHVRKLPSGRYQVLVKHNGKRASASARTLAEARQRGAELVFKLGGQPRDDTATVEALLAMHLAAVEDDWSPTTLADANSVVRLLPQPFLERRVRDVSPAVIAGLYRQLTAQGVSAHRLRRIRMVLSGAWKRAISYEWAVSNPCRDVPMPKATKPDLHPPSDDQVRAVLAETDSGLDIDALRVVGEGINAIMRAPDKGVLLITHYPRILRYITPDFVHWFVDGAVVEVVAVLPVRGPERVAGCARGGEDVGPVALRRRRREHLAVVEDDDSTRDSQFLFGARHRANLS